MAMFSCKKDEPTPTSDPIVESDYMQLEIGNYWVYQTQSTDSGMLNYKSEGLDSILISGDTLIGGNRYYKKYSVKEDHESYLRDSSGYLVDHYGEILFSDHDFVNILRTDTLEPGIALIEYRMHEGDTLISTQFGDFQALDFEGMVTPFDPSYPHGIQYVHYFYASGYGMVKSSSYFYNSPHRRLEKILLRFGNIQE